MSPDARRRRPQPGNAAVDLAALILFPLDGDEAEPRASDAGPGQVDDLAGALVVQLTVNDMGDVRSYVYRSLSSATAAVRHAQARGRAVTVTLCQLVPVTEVEL